jgi:hypothetical protein
VEVRPRELAARRLGHRGLQRDDVVRPIHRGVPPDEPGQEVFAERLVVAVQLAVASDDHEGGRLVGRVREPGDESLADERVRVVRRPRLERDRRRQQAVVQDDDHRPTVPEIQTMGATRVDHPVHLPRREDGERDAFIGEDPQRRQVDGRLG